MKRYALAACFTAVAICNAGAETYPARAITVVVPFATGGAVDVMARMFAAKISENVGQPVVVENRGGGGATIGIGAVATAEPNGYRILYAPNTAAIVPAFYSKLPFNPEKDLLPISQAISSSLILVVHPKLKVKSLKELIALAKARPGSLNFGSAGVADPLQLGVELLKMETGVQIEAIQYKGQGPMVTALIAGEVDLGIVSLQTAIPSIRSGQFIPLGVTGKERSKAVPNVPTIGEAGVPGFVIESWHGFFAPARTPDEIVARLHREIVRAGSLPDVKQRIETAGNQVIASTPQAFQALFKADVAKFTKIVQDAKLPMQD